jgi:hypothetical protein
VSGMGRDFPPRPPDDRALRDLVREVLAELVAPIEARLAALEGAVGALLEEPDPVAVSFHAYREKARDVVRRQREKGQIA